MRAAVAASLGLLSFSFACGEPPTVNAPSRTSAEAAPRVPDLAPDEASWGTFHSARFALSLPLPDRKAWKIDDQSRPALHAVHEATNTNLWITITREDELVNRRRCEQKARDLGWIPKGELTTVEDQVTVGPDAFDSRVWVALEPNRKGGSIEGHVYLFGGFLRKCLLVHLATRVASLAEEEALSTRLAVARARMIKKLALDPPQTTDAATVPRETPELRK